MEHLEYKCTTWPLIRAVETVSDFLKFDFLQTKIRCYTSTRYTLFTVSMQNRR